MVIRLYQRLGFLILWKKSEIPKFVDLKGTLQHRPGSYFSNFLSIVQGNFSLFFVYCPGYFFQNCQYSVQPSMFRDNSLTYVVLCVVCSYALSVLSTLASGSSVLGNS